jgi:hypothetical protein
MLAAKIIPYACTEPVLTAGCGNPRACIVFIASMKPQILSLLRLSLVGMAWLLLIQGGGDKLTTGTSNAAAADSTCTHYASPTGTGSGVSSSQPFKITDFWSLAKPGYTLCLLDGQYTGAASMINPRQNLRGTASAPITIRALNDGKVTIDGQSINNPVRLRRNDYFVIEGFNAHHSKSSVVELTSSNHNIVRRVAAWDAADNNTNIFGVHHGSHNLLEDVAGWGIARKIFSGSQGGNYTTIRRAWGRWEGSHVTGPKMTYELAYNNYNMTCENCIGTWSGERMKQNYTLLGYDGNAHITSKNSAKTFTSYGVDHPYGIFSMGGLLNAQTKVLGSIAYVRGSDDFAPSQAIVVRNIDSVEVADTVVYIEPGTHMSKKRFSLNNLKSAVETNLIARNLTGIGGAASTFGSDWQKSSISEGSSLSSVDNVFTGKSGANICYRYKDRALTTEPLWPWPMNQRIMDAMRESGRAPVDVTKTIESMFGPIPVKCKITE